MEAQNADTPQATQADPLLAGLPFYLTTLTRKRGC